VPLFDAITNTSVQLWRRSADKSGGDAVRKLLHRDVLAFVKQLSELERSVAGRVTPVTGRLILPPFDRQGRTIDVEGGDELRFTDYRGVEQEREVITVQPVFTFGELDHIVVEVK
jgi:hypothetical protein